MQTVWTGTLDKMRVAASSAPDGCVQYALTDAWPDAGARSADLPLNGLVGTRVRLEFTGQIHCVACARPIRDRKAWYSQGDSNT